MILFVVLTVSIIVAILIVGAVVVELNIKDLDADPDELAISNLFELRELLCEQFKGVTIYNFEDRFDTIKIIVREDVYNYSTYFRLLDFSEQTPNEICELLRQNLNEYGRIGCSYV